MQNRTIEALIQLTTLLADNRDPALVEAIRNAKRAIEDYDRAEADKTWRRLALQFDEHRMAALSHLQCMVQDPEKHRDVAIKFLSAPPLSGNIVLAQRLAAIAQDCTGI